MVNQENSPGRVGPAYLMRSLSALSSDTKRGGAAGGGGSSRKKGGKLNLYLGKKPSMDQENM